MTSSTQLSGFVPAGIDAGVWENVRPLFDALTGRDVRSAGELETWLADRSELDATCSEARAELYIAMTCRTDNEGASAAWTRYLEDTLPPLKKASFALDVQQAKLMKAHELDAQRYGVLARETETDVRLFREQNVPIESELAKLDQQYDKLIGAMMVDFDGETRTLPQMSKFQESGDRELRERAWRAGAERRLQDADAIETIFDEMLAKRHTLAQNAGFEDYRAYAFDAMHRFDYTPAMCESFHDAVEKHVIPFVKRLELRRRVRLGIDRLRPWDTAVDDKGREPLTPFTTGQELIDKTRDVFGKLDGGLAALFRSLGDDMAGSFDLESRKGKAAGGYQYMRDRSRTPFIFMNAAGLHRDVETMVHEAGHAFHSLLCKDEPLVHYRHSPIEFAEVASMTMELLTMPHWGAFYPSAEDADRARRKQMEGSLALLPWIATIDAFQHWMYTHPGHSRGARRECWLAINERFGSDLDWTGIEESLEKQWQRQGHLFGVPFYYIEYGIAQLGALGIWMRSLEEGVDHALSLYTEALTIGGARSLPELFETAGVPFDFSAARIGSLVRMVEDELEKLPE